MSCVFLTFFFDYEIKAGHKFISLTMKADFEKKYQSVIGKFGIYFLTYYIWLSWSLIYINKPKEMDKILSPVMVALWRGVPPENNM